MKSKLFLYFLLLLSMVTLSQEEVDSLNYYYSNGQFQKVLALSDALISSHEYNNQFDSIRYIGYLSYKGVAFLEMDEYSSSEPLLLEALSKAIEFRSISEALLCMPNSNLGLLYFKKEEYTKAEEYLLESLRITELEYGNNSMQYATIVGNLAELYFDINNLDKAEKFYLEAISLKKNILGEQSYDYGLSLNNFGAFYLSLGQYRKALDMFAGALKIIDQSHPNYLIAFNNYALCARNLGEYVLAEKWYLHIINAYKEIGSFQGGYIMVLNNLGELYASMKKYAEAEKIFLEVIKNKKILYGENSLNYALSKNNIGLVYSGAKDYKKAEMNYLEALKIYEARSDKKNEDYENLLNNIILLYVEQGRYEEVTKYLVKSTELLEKGLFESLDFLSEDEMTFYKKTKLNEYKVHLSLLNDNLIPSDRANKVIYQNNLMIKNLSLHNQQRIKKSILNSGNYNLQEKYKQYILEKRKLAKLKSLPPSHKDKLYDSINDYSEILEKDIIRLSKPFSDAKKTFNINYDQIRDKLRPDEILIDFITFNYYNDVWTDSIMTSVFVIKKDYEFPKFITLFEEKQLDSILGNFKNDNSKIDDLYTERELSDLFLNSIKNELTGVKTIYLSPSGLGHQINFSALPISENKNLGEQYDVHILGSSSKVIDYRLSVIDFPSKPELLLYGDIDYDNVILEKNSLKDTVVDFLTDEFVELASRSGIGHWSYLPGSAVEVTQISQLAKQNDFESKIIGGEFATKESIKRLDGRITPYILHIATHGFFFPDPEIELQEINEKLIDENSLRNANRSLYRDSENPMIRSGLLFAGANKYWSKEVEFPIIDNGILTADEISNLDLSSCKLVVLSACETGLGDIDNYASEGVFGLQRAFKMAGVKNIIMSLWKVPDKQTAELFEEFYKFAMDGKSIHESFRLAQGIMKNKYRPYFWAGFVLLE